MMTFVIIVAATATAVGRTEEPMNHAVEKHCGRDVPTARRFPSFQWIAADAAIAKEASLVEASLVITTTIQLAGAVDERSYRAPRH
jgi:hypothetical protein